MPWRRRHSVSQEARSGKRAIEQESGEHEEDCDALQAQVLKKSHVVAVRMRNDVKDKH